MEYENKKVHVRGWWKCILAHMETTPRCHENVTL